MQDLQWVWCSKIKAQFFTSYATSTILSRERQNYITKRKNNLKNKKPIHFPYTITLIKSHSTKLSQPNWKDAMRIKNFTKNSEKSNTA